MMKIIVCIKQVPDTTVVKIDPVKGTLIREGVPAVRAAADAGFNDYSVFHRAFRSSFGISPSALK